MQNVIISLNRNLLRVSAIVNKDVVSGTVEIPREVVNDSQILNIDQFTSIVSGKMRELQISTKRGAVLTYVCEPQDVIARFVTFSKEVENTEEFILNDISNKIPDFDTEKMFYSYEKIAPFVYQFLAVKKSYIETLIEFSNALQVPLGGVYSWLSLLPRYVGTNDPAIFIAKVQDEQVVALSELGGIFFSGTYAEEMTSEGINTVVSELSVYNRSKPIKKIYTLNYGTFTLGSYEVTKVDIPGGDDLSDTYDVNMLVNYMLDFMPDLDGTQANLLNTLPLPQIKSGSTSLVKTTSAVGSIVVVGLVLGSLLIFRNKAISSDKSALANGQNNQESVVLSEAVVKESTESTNNNPVAEVTKIAKDEVVIRVENGSGITGIALKTQNLLNEIGYNVTEIDTATENRETTLLKSKPSKSAILKDLAEDMKDKYPQIESEDSLGEDSKYDVLIIVGSSVDL